MLAQASPQVWRGQRPLALRAIDIGVGAMRRVALRHAGLPKCGGDLANGKIKPIGLKCSEEMMPRPLHHFRVVFSPMRRGRCLGRTLRDT